MMLAKFALGGLALYVGLVAVLALGQGALVFPRGAVGAAPSLPAHTQWLQLGRGDVTLQGVRIAGRQPDLPVLLGFGGNAWNAESMALYLHQIAPDHDVVAYHYRGYAPSTGTPSSAALMADAEAIFDATSAPQGAIAVGFSIGSGIAAHLGAVRPLRALALVTPFDNLRAVAQGAMPFVPVRWLFRHQIDTLSALRTSTMPATLIIAARDEVIAPARSRALIDGLAQAGRVVQVVNISAGHNDIYNSPAAQAALRAAFR